METETRRQELERYRIGVTLKDCSSILLRPLTRDDEGRVIDLVSRLSPDTVYLRFHRAMHHLSREQARRLCDLDLGKAFGLAAVFGEGAEEKIVGMGHYVRQAEGEGADVAFLVDDKYQGRGIGSRLLEQLAQIARQRGVDSFIGLVLGQNEVMIKVLRNSGFRLETEIEQGIFRMVLDLCPTPLFEEKYAKRDQAAAVAALKTFLRPAQVAVIGASRKPGTIGNRIFLNLSRHRFHGPIYPVNPNTQVVEAERAYPSILEVPGEVELAIVVVPAALAEKVVEECGKKGVRGVIVISAGFGEAAGAGAERGERLLEICRRSGMRLLGPNCMGLINNDPQVNLFATSAAISPGEGRIALCAQSGALGLALLDYVRSLNLGLASFVSIGNRADVSSNDFLQYFEDDPRVGVILLYLESFGNPREFSRIARRVTATKPVVAVRKGRIAASPREPATHTGALAATELAQETLFAQAGITRVNTLEELFDAASLLAHQPIPRGRRVAIITNGAGPGTMTAESCRERGLQIPRFSEKTLARLRKILPAGAGSENPVDLSAEATAEDYRRVLGVLAEEDYIDAVVVIFIPPVVSRPEEVARVIREAAPLFRQQGKTMAASFLSVRGMSRELGNREEGQVPVFSFPESTANALLLACEYGEWLKKPKGTIPKPSGADREGARELLIRARAGPPGRAIWLDPIDTAGLLARYGIAVVPTRKAATVGQAAAEARGLGFPVAVKLCSPTITHRIEVGGVRIDLKSEDEVGEAFAQIHRQLEKLGRAGEMEGVIVQKMVPEGIEVIIGMAQDPAFGPLIMFGLGGVYTELFRDVVFRLHPLTEIDAEEMVRGVRAFELLRGWRGAPPSDIKSLEDLLCRVSALVEDLPEIIEMDLNPVRVLRPGQEYVVTDARILIS